MTPKNMPPSFFDPDKKTDQSLFASDNLSDFIARYCDSYLKNNEIFPSKGGLYALLISEIDRSLFQTILHHTKGNQSQTAEILGINRNTLRKKLKDLEIIHEKK